MTTQDFKAAYMALETEVNDLRVAAAICAKCVHEFSNADTKVEGKPLDLETWLELHEQTIEHAAFAAYLVSSLADKLHADFASQLQRRSVKN